MDLLSSRSHLAWQEASNVSETHQSPPPTKGITDRCTVHLARVHQAVAAELPYAARHVFTRWRMRLVACTERPESLACSCHQVRALGRFERHPHVHPATDHLLRHNYKAWHDRCDYHDCLQSSLPQHSAFNLHARSAWTTDQMLLPSPSSLTQLLHCNLIFIPTVFLFTLQHNRLSAYQSPSMSLKLQGLAMMAGIAIAQQVTYIIDPNNVDIQQRQVWCDSQTAQCPVSQRTHVPAQHC